jgi:hypothetical protein
MRCMADCHNIIVLPVRGRADKDESARLEALRVAMGQLDELGYRLQQFSPQPSWSAKRWTIASTPFRMRLTGACNRLGDLAKINLADEQNAIRWAFKLNTARLEAERRLHDISVCLGMLQSADTSPGERMRETEIFSSNKSELLKALREIGQLIAQRFPAVLGRN